MKQIIFLLIMCITLLSSSVCDKSDDDTKNAIVPQNNSETNNDDNNNNNNNIIAEKKVFSDSWVSSQNYDQLIIVDKDKNELILTQGTTDIKPVWSKDGSKIAFVRHFAGYLYDPEQWDTKICVINEDGTGLQELTDGSTKDFNPTWTRDGSNKLVFNRLVHDEAAGTRTNEIFLADPETGSIEKISDPDGNDFEWASSFLQDGRVLIDKCEFWKDNGVWDHTCKTYLLTPEPGSRGTYQEVSRYTDKLWHKMSLSQDETKVTYMLTDVSTMMPYRTAVIYYADFNKDTLTISNPVEVKKFNTIITDEYPRWNPTGEFILFDSNATGSFEVYAYRLSDGEVQKITDNDSINYQLISVKGAPK